MTIDTTTRVRRCWLVALAATAAAGPWCVPRAAPTGTRPTHPALKRLGVDLSRHGVVVMLRHARTEPGVGDPPGYSLADCRSQRQLSADGRAQSQRIGPALAAQGLVPTQVRSSRWCRCLDTATLAFGQATPWQALDSFFDAREREPAQSAELRQALVAQPAGEVAVWVTHMVNIAALSGESLGLGEAVLLRGERDVDGRPRVITLGRVATDTQTAK
ncbi:histidine phosphatase family protein [Ideonella sp. A 288]|uniref:histidine phosphatase family protein n=1 Tax=Ideonella sp. A 288 TaxID=1962181 RepID=UPI000B4B886A|nr:histidine phosphatase family protein [Ideonella sp. A 288]